MGTKPFKPFIYYVQGFISTFCNNEEVQICNI